ncbi:ABC transporter permease [Corynebacterium sp. H113]|uniref:ABC transporter permease n=1 Tax=Corynebacterium sp. H113 TaxID=3133419 RepID=UPI0030A3A709
MPSLVNALKAESTKMVSLRSTWVWMILLTGSLYGPLILVGLLGKSGTQVDWEMLLVGAMIFSLMAVSYAGSSIAAEYSEKMYAHAFLSQDRRSYWLIARSLLIIVFIAINAIVGGFLAWVVVAVLPKPEFVGGDITQVWALSMMTLMFSIIAMWCAVLTRSRVVAVAVPLVWMIVVEQLLSAAAGSDIGRMFWLVGPGTRTTQIAGVLGGHGNDMEVGWHAMQIQPLWFNVAVVLAWIGVAIATSFLVNARRDVR